MRAERPQVLYLVHRVPYPPDKGDRIRNFHILRYLSGFATVDLACIADEPVDESTGEVFNRLCRRWRTCQVGPFFRRFAAAVSLLSGSTLSEGAFYSRDLRHLLMQWSTETTYDVVVISSSAVMQYLDAPGLQNVRAVVDLIDVDSEKWLDYSRTSTPPLNWLYGLEGRRLRVIERVLRPNVAAVMLVSNQEAELYRCVGANVPVHAIGNGVDLDYFTGRPAEGTTTATNCIFVGAMDYPPNIDAAVWFAREVWPQIGPDHPQSRFLIVGRNPVGSVRRLAGIPGVEVTGTVADVRPWYAGSAVAVAPLRIARGVQNKVLEAMAMCVPTVLSEQALCGLSARPNDDVLVAHSPEEWAQTIRRLLEDRSQRERLAQAGRTYVERYHSWSNQLNPLKGLLTTQLTAGTYSPLAEAAL